MPTFEPAIQNHLDARVATLGKIKARSLGADIVMLTALNVLVYAQLEGGVKDLAACVLRNLNSRRMSLGDIRPGLLEWRNPDALDRFRRAITFDVVGMPSPFAAVLAKRFTVRPINRRHELNQMSWASLSEIYVGLGLDRKNVETLKTKIDQMVDARNAAAHYGDLPGTTSGLMEKQVRENVGIVEDVLWDFSVQLLPFFTMRLHRR